MQTQQTQPLRKILIVEDDLNMAATYAGFLREQGYNVRIETHGDKALLAVDVFFPDLIILDIILPGLDGFSVIETLRKQEDTKQIPILVVSNLVDKDKINMAVKLGAQDYITKPNLTMDYLNEKIKWLLKLH